MEEYYKLRGWDPATGIPRRSTLEKQGLKKIADELENKYGVELPE
jgi:aldehyde:ferredoxin oxidoreductase